MSKCGKLGGGMKFCRSIPFICMVCVCLSACTSSINQITQDDSRTATMEVSPSLTITQTTEPTFTPSSTSTATIQPTKTQTPTPTIQLPVTQNTPIPFRSEQIIGSNITQVQLLASWGDSFISSAKYFQAYDTVILKTYDGFEVMDPETYEIKATIHLEGYNNYSDQVIGYEMIDSAKLIALIKHCRIDTFEVAILDLNSGEFISSQNILHERVISGGIFSDGGNQISFIDTQGYVFIVPIDDLSDIKMIGRVFSGYKTLTSEILQFSPNGKTLAFLEVFYEGTNIVHLWDVTELKYIGPVHYEANVMEFMPSSSTLVLASDLIGQVKFIDAPTRQVLNVHSPGRNAYDSIFVSPGGEFLLSFSDLNEIFVWDIETGALLSRIDSIGYDDSNIDIHMMEMLFPLKSAYFHKQENYITLISTNHNFKKIDITNGTILEIKNGNAHSYTGPVFVNQDSWIVFADENGLIQIWDLETNKLIKEIQHEKRISWLNYASEKNWLFFGDGMEERYIDLDSFEIFSFSNSRLRNVKISPDQKLLAGTFRGIIHVFDIDSKNLLSKFTSKTIGNFIFSPDRKLIAGSISSETEHGVVVWDVERRYQIIEISSKNFGPDFAFSDDGKYLFISDSTRSSGPWYEKWDTENWNMVEKISTDFRVQFTMNGKYVKNENQWFLLEDLSNPLVSLSLGYSPVLSEYSFFIASSEGGKLFLWGIK